MSHSDGKFHHESLQDRKTIKLLLNALTKGVSAGELTLSDENDELVLPIDGLMTLRIKGERSDGRCRVDLRISWTETATAEKSKSGPQIK